MTTIKANLWDLPEDDDTLEAAAAPLAGETLAIDYTALEEEEAARDALSIARLHANASPFEIHHHQRKEQASGFNADLWNVLEPLLKDRDAVALAATAAKHMGLERTYTAQEVSGFSPEPISAGHRVLAILIQRTMRPSTLNDLVWSMPNHHSAEGNQLNEAIEVLTPLLRYLVDTSLLETTPATRGRLATYALKRRLELAKQAAEALPVSGIILFLDSETLEVMPNPTAEQIAAGEAVPEVALDYDGTVTCITTGTILPCGLGKWFSVPFVSPDEGTIEELYNNYVTDRAKTIALATTDEQRAFLQAELEPTYWGVLRRYPSHVMTVLVGKDSRGRLQVHSDIGQHMTESVREALTFIDGSTMNGADGKAFMLSLTAAIIGNCSPEVAAQLNLAPRLDGKTMPQLLDEAQRRDNGEELPATAGHRDPYGAVWLNFTKSLKRALVASAGLRKQSPREYVKYSSTPAGYGAGQDTIIRALVQNLGCDRDTAQQTAAQVVTFPPLADALRIMRKAHTPCASYTGTISFVYEWEDEVGEPHHFTCETSTTIDNSYVGREWRINDVLVLRTDEMNLSKARTALLANLNQGIEAWLLECQAAFAKHLGVELWSTHDQTSTKSEYLTRLITGISASALNAIVEQALPDIAAAFGLNLPKRTHQPYDIDTPLYVFPNEEAAEE